MEINSILSDCVRFANQLFVSLSDLNRLQQIDASIDCDSKIRRESRFNANRSLRKNSARNSP